MSLIFFCTAFILQFVGHRIGDYFFQTDYQAQHKAIDFAVRLRHCVVYAFIIGGLMLVTFDFWTALMVYLLTVFEHLIIDSRTPVVWWKNTLERIVGNRGFDIGKIPFFVLIEIDQTIHIVRIFVISLLIGYGVL